MYAIQGFVECLVLLSKEFFRIGWTRKELDGLAGRMKVVSMLVGDDEEIVATRWARLAASAVPGSMTEQLVDLTRR
jgi:hypothetical protein